MTTTKNTKLEIDSKTIEVISNICELSGQEIPESINTPFLEMTSKRIKDILIALKNQLEESSKSIDDSKKQTHELKKIVEDQKKYIEELKGNPHPETKREETQNNSESSATTEKTPPDQIKNILIIANIGVIMHQLKILFNKSGCNVKSVKSYTEAIGELKHNSYECILFDMSTATDNDLMLVEALKKATEICHTNTLIVILTAPIRDKNLMKTLKSKGADIIIEKQESWHMNILKELKLA
jgi:CheY-like chemotaxis protein